MELQDIIDPDRIAYDIDVSSKKRALETVSDILVKGGGENLVSHDICESLIAREKLGSTGIGCGVAIPHGRLKNTEKTLAAFIKLHKGVDYDAIDNQDVDLIFALLVPEHSTEEHLKILAEVAEMFSNAEFREKLRHADNQQALWRLLKNWKKKVSV
ncbi:MAG: PTS IIA-like nitrogen regulatory protein PtsN [Gammaproteobacteria bacterium]|jgi:PTS system nitrogen regulatory IIA component